MEEIKVGEYVRTKEDGYIGKKVRDGLRKGTIEIEDNVCSWLINTYNISKHSPNLIDLIEVGDYVNGEPVEEKASWKKDEFDLTEITTTTECLYKPEDIKSIVTHEQFAEIEYKIEE